jgi:hypothetical protein
MGKNASCDRLLHREIRANRSSVVVGVLRIRYSQNDYIIFSQSLPSFRSISDLIKNGSLSEATSWMLRSVRGVGGQDL